MDTPDPPVIVRGRFATSRRRLTRRLGLAGYLLVLGPGAVHLVLDEFRFGEDLPFVRALTGVVLCAALSGPVLLVLAIVLRRTRWSPGALRVVDGKLTRYRRDDDEGIPVGEVVQGARRPAAVDGFELTLADGEVLLGECGPGVEALLWALKVAPSQRAATLRTSAATTPAPRASWLLGLLAISPFLLVLTTTTSSFLGPYVMLLSLLLFELPSKLPWLLLPVLAWALAWKSLGPTVTVGVDGLRVDGLWRKRFHPWSEVRKVSARYGALRATLTYGDSVYLGGTWGTSAIGAAALRARIETTRSLPVQESPRGGAETARHGLEVGPWRDAMAGLLRRVESRVEPVTEEDLLTVLGGRAATTEQRAGAALALMGADPARNAARVRAAAGRLVDRDARRILEAIAEGTVDDAALEEVSSDAEEA